MNESPINAKSLNILSRVLYEDNHILALNKLTGELSQGDKTGNQCVLDTVSEFLKDRDRKPGNVFLGLPHRLDRPTSGILLLAKTSKALSRFTELFRERNVQKVYWMIVESPMSNEEGELTQWILHNPRTNKAHVSDTTFKSADEARLRWKTIGHSDRYWFMAVELLTGRHHQIRAQLAAKGVHIRGDLKYGAKRSLPGGGIDLHAGFMKFEHPITSKIVQITADPRLIRTDRVWETFPLSEAQVAFEGKP